MKKNCTREAVEDLTKKVCLAEQMKDQTILIGGQIRIIGITREVGNSQEVGKDREVGNDRVDGNDPEVGNNRDPGKDQILAGTIPAHGGIQEIGTIMDIPAATIHPVDLQKVVDRILVKVFHLPKVEAVVVKIQIPKATIVKEQKLGANTKSLI
ncbi:uncharacterized protein LOC108105741 [Drosophila eugracilis]|uniref:uncharacterized protein LOC108105741 n=1 Tax=Drosophila eugracilis TaxID=29029 RepID=UPI001BDAF7FC|nr:uncharacterized protein LOC108105741 [Drosophila eugracilis]